MKQYPCQPAKDPIASRWDLWFWNEVSVFMETSVQRIDQAGMCPNLQPKVKDKLLQSLGSATSVGLVSCNRFPLVSCFDCRLRKHEWLLRPKAHASWLLHVCSSIPNQLCCWSEEMKQIKTWHRWETAYLRYIDQMNKPENSIFFLINYVQTLCLHQALYHLISYCKAHRPLATTNYGLSMKAYVHVYSCVADVHGFCIWA